MKKIFIGKNEDPARIVEIILSERDRDVVLVVPKFSKLSGSVSNFHIIKREAEAGDKNLVIESVDDDALALAQAAGIASINPFLSARRKSMSDIIAPEDQSPDFDQSSPFVETAAAELEENSSEDVTVDFAAPRPGRHRPRFSKRRAYILIFAVLILPLLWFGFENISPTTTIAFTLKEYSFSNDTNITVSTDTNDPDFDNHRISGELFSERKTATITFPASGSKKVERKATGQVIIYNAFSSADQPLVASTRLLTPDGRLFRLTESLTVPGAKIEQGKIIPSSITASVIADHPGESYNVGPISRFSIPGFQGSSKYEGFYAESKETMSGGFVGTTAFPEDEDIDQAKSKLEQILGASANVATLSGIPDNFEIVTGATEFAITKIEVNEITNDNGEFSVYGEAVIKTIAIASNQLKEILTASAASDLGFKVSLRQYELNPSDLQADFDIGSLSFNLGSSGTVVRDIDISQFKNEIKGKEAAELKAEIISTIGVENARISFWPFWANRVPSRPDKIVVTFD